MFSLGKHDKQQTGYLRVKTLYFPDNSNAVFKSIFAIAGSVIAEEWRWVDDVDESDLILVNIDHEDGRFYMELNAHNPYCVPHGKDAKKTYSHALNKPLLSSDIIDLFDDCANKNLKTHADYSIHLGLTRWLSFDETAGYTGLDQVAMTIARFQPSFTDLMEKTSMSESMLRQLVLRLRDMGCLKLLSKGECGYRDDLVDRRMADDSKWKKKDRRGAAPAAPLANA